MWITFNGLRNWVFAGIWVCKFTRRIASSKIGFGIGVERLPAGSLQKTQACNLLLSAICTARVRSTRTQCMRSRLNPFKAYSDHKHCTPISNHDFMIAKAGKALLCRLFLGSRRLRSRFHMEVRDQGHLVVSEKSKFSWHENMGQLHNLVGTIK